MLFDSHTHYDDPAFDPDREALLAALPGRGVSRVMAVGADLASSRAALELAQNYPYIYASVGFHPQDADKLDAAALAALEALCAQPRVRALGEIGLDYHYDDAPARELQKEAFSKQLALAERLRLPVIVHTRDAWADTLALLPALPVGGGVVHCFSGSAESALYLAAQGWYIGFTGAVTFKNARRALEAAAALPLERLLIETDCPYMAPEPYRGRRSDSSMLPAVLERLAALKGVTAEELARITCENACRLYRLPFPE